MSLALHPEALHDLRASGLTDESIMAAHIHSVAPRDLDKQLGPKLAPCVAHAYVLPYHTVGGAVNGFARLKLFPAPDHDLEVRYWQAPKSGVHLYMPPGPDWEQIAADASIQLALTEGEKKALCACQYGLYTVAIGGCWNFYTKLNEDQRITLPELDLFVWKDRLVEIPLDSDGWRAEKLFDVLAGFYALAMELTSRGARVVFVRLPDLSGLAKTGLDDWLVREGAGWRDTWRHLERVPLDDRRLHPIVKWWQARREKQATEDAIRQHDLDDLAMTETAGLYTVRSVKHGVRFTFDRLSEQRGGVSAEITVILGTTELVGVADLGLKSDTGHTKLASSLKQFAAAIPWKLLLQKACTLVLKHHRRGEPSRRLTSQTVVPPLRFSLNPFCHQHKPTILFADGGTGKSTLGLLCAMLVSVGGSVAGISALKGKPLYLDYEDDADTHARRMQAIQAGHPELLAAEVDYLRCTEAIPRMQHTLVRKIQEDQITFLLIDSLVAAAGGEASLEAVGKFFAAIRVLNLDVLCIGHVPKPQGDKPEQPTVYGSVFNQNYARMLWEVRRDHAPGEDVAILALVNPKNNDARLHRAFGLQVTHNEAGSLIRFEPSDLSQSAELESALPVACRIRNFLEQDGGVYTAKEISEGTDIKLSVVKATLANKRYKGNKWHMVGENRQAKWTVLNR